MNLLEILFNTLFCFDPVPVGHPRMSAWEAEEKPSLVTNKGGGGGSTPPVPTPPVINIPPAPVAPPPPPGPTNSSFEIAQAQAQGAKNAAAGFGFRGTLLQNGDPTANTATGKGSLLGN